MNGTDKNKGDGAFKKPKKLKLRRRRFEPLPKSFETAAGRTAFVTFSAFNLAALIFILNIFALEPSVGNKSDAVYTMPASENDFDAAAAVVEPAAPEPEDNVITLSFVGDCMLASMLGSTAYGSFGYLADTEPQEYFFSGVSDIFLNDDFTVANCENVFTDDETLSPTYKDYTPAYWYRSKSANAGIFKTGGVDIVSIANNHANDYGKKGYDDTVAALEENGVEWGDNSKTVYVEKLGKKIALILCTFYYNGADSVIAKQIRAARDEGADYVIVYYHGGTERVYEPDRWRVNGSRNLVNAGADLVIGGHPHVLQPLEEYNGKYIVHSLGNFLFGGSTRPENRTIILQYKITLGDDGADTAELSMIPCYCYVEPWQPAVIEDEAQKQRVLDFMCGLAETPL